MTGHRAGLPAHLVDRAFPFHFSVGPDGRLLQVGPGLAAACPARPGRPVDEVIDVQTPAGLPLHGPAARDAGLVLLRPREGSRGMLLRGELGRDGDVLWFLGSPWVTDLADLDQLGLSIADFAAHDPVFDLLLLVQAHRAAREDAERLIDRLRVAAAEQARAAREERLLSAELKALPDLALRLDRDGTLLAVRPARTGATAIADERLVGRNAYEALPWLAAELPSAVLRALAEPEVQALSAHLDDDGQVRHLEIRVMGSTDDQVLVLVRDVSDVHDLEEQLRHRAFHDPLTGLANRSLFADRIEHALAGIERDAAAPVLLLIDLDGFKAVNDKHGHVVGDDLLTLVAQRLAAAVRPQDTVARLGGDEFAVLLDDGGRPEGERVAGRLLDSVGRPMRTADGVTLSPSASIGVVCARADDDLSALFRHADVALYAAKRSGKQRYTVYDEAMRQRMHDRSSLKQDFRRALVEGQLLQHYQPIRDLETGEVHGWEALLRWQHPLLGLLSPELFLRLAEDLGAMDLLAARALRRASLDVPRLGAPVHVNVSASQLDDPSLPSTVAASLAEAGLPGSSLVLELTEASLRQTPGDLGAVLHELRGLGVGLSLDDFGVGYSTLGRLHRLPFTEIKIDRSFVAGLGQPGGDAVASAVIGLGHGLGLRVVAEGVETEHQAADLVRLGCRLGQGFHLGRPAAVP